MAYADGVTPFKQVAEETPAPNAYTHLKGLDQEKTCHIAQAADLCIMLTKGLNESKGVFKQVGSVSGASWSDVSSSRPHTLISSSNIKQFGNWNVKINSPDEKFPDPTTISSNLLVLCTGST